jgi:hypothetical protein
MPRITINYESTTLTPEPLPIGTFAVRISRVTLAPSKSSGRPTLYFEGEIIQPGEVQGKRAVWNISLDAQWRIMMLQVASGQWTESELAGNKSYNIDTDDLVGLEVGVIVEPDVNRSTGAPTTKISRFIASDECRGASGEDYKAVAAAAAGAASAGGLGSLFDTPSN